MIYQADFQWLLPDTHWCASTTVSTTLWIWNSELSCLCCPLCQLLWSHGLHVNLGDFDLIWVCKITGPWLVLWHISRLCWPETKAVCVITYLIYICVCVCIWITEWNVMDFFFLSALSKFAIQIPAIICTSRWKAVTRHAVKPSSFINNLRCISTVLQAKQKENNNHKLRICCVLWEKMSIFGETSPICDSISQKLCFIF